MFLVVKKRTLIIAFIAIIAICVLAGSGFAIASVVSSPTVSATVVIDVGHGGIDGGVVGVNSKVSEATINLAIAKKVSAQLKDANIKAVLTRNSQDGLYGDTSPGHKKRDMRARQVIIDKTMPALVVSIHGNKFPKADRRGAQVFFEDSSPTSKLLATSVQNSINTINQDILKRSFAPLSGDYYILKCSRYPSVIVECGFLSNPEDDKLLNTESHQTKLAHGIASGIIGFLALKPKV